VKSRYHAGRQRVCGGAPSWPPGLDLARTGNRNQESGRRGQGHAATTRPKTTHQLNINPILHVDPGDGRPLAATHVLTVDGRQRSSRTSNRGRNNERLFWNFGR
jgi:hypothetical protein